MSMATPPGKPDVVVFGYLVESLSARVVDRGAEHLDRVVALHARDDRVAAGNEHAEIGILDVLLQVGRVDVRENVVHPDQWLARCPRESLGKGKTRPRATR